MKDSAGYITQEEAIEFKELCKRYLGKNLSLNEAQDQGTRAVMLMEKLVGFEPVLETYKDAVDLRFRK
ncbi:MAG: hypothetical protein ABIJ05_04475 [Patescibacteria group bacterium]